MSNTGSCNYILQIPYICDVLRDLVPFVQFKRRENTHGEVLLLVKLQFDNFRWL